MKQQRYWVRAIVAGLITTLTALAIYDRPPELAAYWQPMLQGTLVALSALGLNVGTASKK